MVQGANKKDFSLKGVFLFFFNFFFYFLNFKIFNSYREGDPNRQARQII